MTMLLFRADANDRLAIWASLAADGMPSSGDLPFSEHFGLLALTIKEHPRRGFLSLVLF